MASLGLYCFPIEHIFGICTTLSWHSGFPIPIQLPYLCGKKGYNPGKQGNFLNYAYCSFRSFHPISCFPFPVPVQSCLTNIKDSQIIPVSKLKQISDRNYIISPCCSLLTCAFLNSYPISLHPFHPSHDVQP